MSKRKPNNPITKVRTGTGDSGTTFLRHPDILKSDSLVHFVGDLDEANAFLGSCTLSYNNQKFIEPIVECQRVMFVIGAGVHTQDTDKLHKIDVNLDKFVNYCTDEIDYLQKNFDVTPLTGFIYPDECNASLMVTRAIVRRAERSAVASGCDWAVPALNAMSDLIFTMAWVVSSESEFHTWDSIDD